MLLLCACFVLSLSSCDYSERQENFAPNPSSNLRNGSVVCGNGDRIYYLSALGPFAYSCKTDGSDFQTLGGTEEDYETSSYCFVVDNWLYFYGHDYSAQHLIRKKFDGTGRQEIRFKEGQESASEIQFDGQYIYYGVDDEMEDLLNKQDGQDGKRVIGGETWRMTLDGKDHQKIFDQRLIDYVVQDGWIYFCDYEKDYYLYKMKIDGTEVTQLTDTPAFRVQAEEDWVYYISGETVGGENCTLARIKKDGTEQMDYPMKTTINYNVSGGMIYFTDTNDSGSLYRIDVDGSEPELILSEETIREVTTSENYTISNINVLDGHIYFRAGYGVKAGEKDTNGNRQLIFHCTTDGENLKMLERELFEQKQKDGTLQS